MKIPLSVIVLTYNEEIHIERLVKNIADWADEVFIVDSYSADGTAQIAKRYGAKIFQHPFENQARQFNWALDNLPIKNDWILRLDADEYLSEELKDEIVNVLRNTKLYENTKINGFFIKRRVYFMGRWIKHGGYYPFWFLRLFKKGKARSEERKMDEHIVLLEGESGKLENDFVDNNLKGLKDWIEKHKNYASREAREARLGNYGEGGKRKFYYRLPPFLRPILYFLYRYFFKLGFLDGVPGLVFHFLHAFWYRFLVDAKIYEDKIKK